MLVIKLLIKLLINLVIMLVYTDHGDGDGDDDVLPHQVPLLAADKKGPCLWAITGEYLKKNETFHTNTFTFTFPSLGNFHPGS